MIWAVSGGPGRLLFPVCGGLFSGQGSDSVGAPGCCPDPLSQQRLVLQQMGREVGQVAAGGCARFKHAPIMLKVSHDAVFLLGCCVRRRRVAKVR